MLAPMQKRAWIAAGCALLLACSAVTVACGSARPPDEVVRLSPGPDAAANNRNISGGSGGRLCSEDGFHEPSGAACTCTYAYSSNSSITFACGVTLCTDGKREAAVCHADGKLDVLPGYDSSNCPDAGANLDKLPPCDAGAATPDGG